MKTVISLFIFFIAASSAVWASGPLTLSDAQRLALDNHPSLKPFTPALNAQEGLIQQAGLGPSPELEFEAENFLGSGEFQTFGGIETTLGVSQTFETAGKLEKRIDVANREKDIALNEYDIARLRVLHETTQAFIDVLVAQERLEFEESFFSVSQKIFETIQISVEAGRDSPIEETRAKVMVSSSQIGLNRATMQVKKAYQALAFQWGAPAHDEYRIQGALLPLPAPLGLDELQRKIINHPGYVRSQSIIAQRESTLNLETAKATPDFTLGAGVRYLSDVDDGSFVAQFSIPLPFRNRNQGAIRAVQERKSQAEAELLQTEFEMRSQLEQLYMDYLQSRDEAETLQSGILPIAQQAFESAEEGYRQGKFAYLSVLDAQRSLFELQVQLLDSAADVHQLVNDINQITANYDLLNTHQKETTK